MNKHTLGDKQADISLGYYLAMPTFDQEYLPGTGISHPIMSASSSLCRYLPDVERMDLDKLDDATCGYLRSFGIDERKDQEAVSTLKDLYSAGCILWPNVWCDLETMTEFVRRMGISHEKTGTIAIEMSLSCADAQCFVDRQALFPSVKSLGVPQIIPLMAPATSETLLLGYDIVGFDLGGFESWLVCLGNRFLPRFVRHLNAYGLFDRFEDARLCAEFVESDDSDADDIDWYVWKLSRVVLK